MNCDLCENVAFNDSLCKEHLKLKDLGEIEKCFSCHSHWAKKEYACKFCWEEELKVLGENHD